MANVVPIHTRPRYPGSDIDINKAAPRIKWRKFQKEFRWRQGEHMAFIGPTDSGKTTLALSLLPMRRYVVVFASKPKDDTMTNLQARGFVKINEWKPRLPVAQFPNRILWPKATTLDSNDHQAKVFHQAFHNIYLDGNWCVYVDELWYIVNMLKLEKDVKMFLLQARSLGISFVASTQRPAFVPLEIYDQSTHLFFWRDNDERNLNRISGINWQGATTVRMVVSRLEKHEFLYINNRDGQMFRCRVPLKGGNK